MSLRKDSWWRRQSKRITRALRSKWAFFVLYLGALAVIAFPPVKHLFDPANLAYSYAFLVFSVVFGFLMRQVYLDFSRSTQLLSEREWSKVKLRRAFRGAVLLAVYDLMTDYSERSLTRFSFIGAAFSSGVIFLIVYLSKRQDSNDAEEMIDGADVRKLIDERYPGEPASF